MKKKYSQGHHTYPLMRMLGAALSVIYLTTNGIGGPSGEKVFWEQRRESAHLVRQNGVTSAFPPSSTKIETKESAGWLELCTFPYATVREVHISKNPTAPVVLHMQDLHGSLEAQENMARAIESLVANKGLALMGLEGAEGPFTLDDFRRYPDQVRQDVAHFFLKKDLIGAGEFVALTSSRPFVLWGVEDMPLYRQNVAAVKQSLSRRAGAESILSSLEKALEEQKAVLYSEDLRSLDHAVEQYNDGVLPLVGFIKTLLRLCPGTANSSPFPNVRILESALKAEETLNFAAVEKDRRKLFQILTERMGQSSLDGLLHESVEYRKGRQSGDAYANFLRNLCAEHNVPLSAFPHLNAYLTYTGLSGKIQRERLLTELTILEQTTQKRLAKTTDQQELVDLSVDVKLLRKLLRNQMTPEE